MPQRNRITHRFPGLILLAGLGLALILPGGDAVAQQPTDPAAEAARVESELEAAREHSRALEEQANALSRELEGLRVVLVTAARDNQEREALVANLELQIAELQVETRRRREVLATRHQQLAGTLGALTGLSEDSPRAFFLYPGTSLEAVRGSILLQAAIPALGERAAILREDLAALEAVQVDLADKVAQLSQADVALIEDRKRLQALLDRKQALYQQTADQSQAANDRLRELSEKSATLKELMAALEAERQLRITEDIDRQRSEQQATAAEQALDAPAPGTANGTDTNVDNEAAQLASLAVLPTIRPDGIRSFPADGVITAPAVGLLVQQYGQDTGFGQSSKGIVVETRPNVAVLSPFDGKVVFAGPFRDLGMVLIIEHDGGYHSVLAGFSRIDVANGHWILAGEPIGIMPATNISDSDITGGAKTGGGTRPRLYMELRRDGHPVNPLRWITAGSIRVNG